MLIKILGTGCKKCVTLTENTQAALANLGREAEVVKVTDITEIAAMGVMSTPALAIDNQVVSMGKVLSPSEVEALLKALPPGDQSAAVRREGEALLAKLKAWDGDMVQRRSRAYDDVENFPNKFTANYLFLINQTESDLPRVNQPNRDRLERLNAEWAALKARAGRLTAEDIPALNKRLWELGFGAIWKK